jgi:PAS domain-containing protein
VNRLLRKILGYKRDEVTGRWRRPRNEEIYDLYWLANTNRVITSIRMNCSTTGKRESYIQSFGEKT